MPGPMLAVIAIALIIFAVWFFVFISYFAIWIQCKTSGVQVGFIDLIFMKMRKVNVGLIVRCIIKLKQQDIRVSRLELESHFLAGGNVEKVADALIRAHMRNVKTDFALVAAIDLAGYDLNDIDPEKFETVISSGGKH